MKRIDVIIDGISYSIQYRTTDMISHIDYFVSLEDENLIKMTVREFSFGTRIIGAGLAVEVMQPTIKVKEPLKLGEIMDAVMWDYKNLSTQ